MFSICSIHTPAMQLPPPPLEDATAFPSGPHQLRAPRNSGNQTLSFPRPKKTDVFQMWTFSIHSQTKGLPVKVTQGAEVQQPADMEGAFQGKM